MHVIYSPGSNLALFPPRLNRKPNKQLWVLPVAILLGIPNPLDHIHTEFKGRPYCCLDNIQADQYGLGCTLQELVTGNIISFFK